jgi:CrcB protein
MINARNILLVLVGSAVGGLMRFITSYLIQQKIGARFPTGTFAVNLIGCFLIGMIFSLAAKNAQGSDDLKLLLATGFCGGFTTFSAFAIENMELFKSGNNLTALTYILLSVTLGIFATFAGTLMFK